MARNNMIYNISGEFYNNFAYPFNIKDIKDKPVKDFGECVSLTAQLLSNDETDHKVRFIWIAAEGYCQTEVFLKQILSKLEYHSLYLHWLDYINTFDISENNPIGKTICNITTEDKKYFSGLDGVKICVIDHAEEIKNIDHIYALSNGEGEYVLNDFIFIFISKNSNGINVEKSFWEKFTAHMGDKENLSITRSKNLFYKVERYDTDTCKEIFEKAIPNIDVKTKCCNMVNSIVSDMRRVLYLDLMIMLIKKYSSPQEMPESFSDEVFINEVYKNASEGFVQLHIKNCATLRDFIEKYMLSDFVKNFPLGEQQRIPLDNYVWACGIVSYTCNEIDYVDNIKLLFDNFEDSLFTRSFDSIFEISKQVISCAVEDTTCRFSIEKYLYALLNNSLSGTKFCAEILNEVYFKIPLECFESLFKAICSKYSENLNSEKDINIFRLLGIQIGRLLPKMRNEVVENSLNCFFEEVKDDYVCPKCNANGISVIPVTNYEFEKFVKDRGYINYYSKEIDVSLHHIARQYYSDLLEYLLSALTIHNMKDSRCLASILKGYDWLQYKQIAYLYSNKDHIMDSEIYDYIINENYVHPLQHPAKWANAENSNTKKPFCNPLQPVVCINLFEARSYAKWLSQKIGKDVRIVKYDPDYISIIGTQDDGVSDAQRIRFLQHIKDNESYINIVENSKLFYGEDFIEIREPAPVAIQNSVFSGVYDFLGNVFESQDTLYNYNYDESVSEATREIFEQKQASLIDYNCPCGGLQRTKANLPPEYMGQVPAFLRNQDIGFRIVISGGEEKGKQHKNSSSFAIEYQESKIEEFFITKKDSQTSKVLCSIKIGKWDKKSRTVVKDLEKSLVYENINKSIMFLSEHESKTGNEQIMLMCDNNNMYAYCLNHQTSIKIENSESKLTIISRAPIIPKELALIKKCQNKHLANWIDIVFLQRNNSVEVYLAHPINIANGFFSVSEHKINHTVKNSVLYKKDNIIVGLYKIDFQEPNHKYRKEYYEGLKTKLGTNFFLPDWINIVDFIEYISTTLSTSGNLDVDTIMAAITTIDTSHLHEQINKSKILTIESKSNLSD